MGLDTYASRTPGDVNLTDEDERIFEEAGIELCGGMFSGDGGSFRGKVYSDVVAHVSGVSLYEEWIPPETVREMAEAFDRCDPEAVERDMAEDGVYETTASEVRNLQRFFRICADRGFGLVGWY
jgi:hypothetical protein